MEVLNNILVIRVNYDIPSATDASKHSVSSMITTDEAAHFVCFAGELPGTRVVRLYLLMSVVIPQMFFLLLQKNGPVRTCTELVKHLL